MGKHKYSSKIENEHSAKAVGRDLGISIKHSVMVCNQLRNKSIIRAKEILRNVIEMKQAIPYTRFNFDQGHKKKIGPGRYPVKTCKEILKVLENVESNAQFKGLNTSLLKIVHINSHKASIPKRYGRKGGLNSKRAHIEVIVEEKAEEKKEKKTTKEGIEKKEMPKDEKNNEKRKINKNDINNKNNNKKQVEAK